MAQDLTSTTTEKHDPDPYTKERIMYLAQVGTALNDTYSDENQEIGTDFFEAKESLHKFKAGIDLLNLDQPSQKGMYDLIEYLEKKIDKRLNDQGQG